MPPTPGEDLARDRRASDITQEDLWMRYFALGGMSRPMELDAIVHDALCTSARDRDLVVLALNERLGELGRAPALPYSDEPPDPEDGRAGGPVETAGLTEGPAHPAVLQRAVDTLAERDSQRVRRLAKAQEQRVYRDTLTGVLRRDAGQDQLQRAVDQAHRTRQPLMLVFLDVDHLKRINDSQGHAAGDLLLRALGDALRASLRSYDVVVRYGGDEFVCGLPRAGIAQASARLDDVSAQLGASVPGASVTVGFAALRDGDRLEDVLRRADEDMYDNRRRQRAGTATGDGAVASVVVGGHTPLHVRVSRFLRAAVGRQPSS